MEIPSTHIAPDASERAPSTARPKTNPRTLSCQVIPIYPFVFPITARPGREYALAPANLNLQNSSIIVKTHIPWLLEKRSVRRELTQTSKTRELRLPPLPPGLEVYRPVDVLGSSVLVVEDEAAMQQQLRIDLHDLGYRPSVASSAPAAMLLLEHERVAAVLPDLVLHGAGEPRVYPRTGI